MATQNTYDEHTLYIKCDCASVDQIRNAFREALINYRNRVDGIATDVVETRYKVNLVTNHDNVSLGFAFVFITNPAVYYMLLGKNCNGSDRIEYRDDPSWVAPTDDKLINNAGWCSTKSTSWADMDEEYDREEEERQRHIRPKIAVQLEPLMTLPPFKLTKEQIDEKKSKIIMENKNKPNFDEEFVEVSDLAYFGVDAAFVMYLDHKYMPNILKCIKIPMWVTKEDIKVEFASYASNSKTLHERFIKGRKIEEAYPFVNINNDRVGFVIFDPTTRDAQFALHMMMKTTISKEVAGKTETVTLIFKHSYRTDRDVVSDIIHQCHSGSRDGRNDRDSRDGRDGRDGRDSRDGRNYYNQRYQNQDSRGGNDRRRRPRKNKDSQYRASDQSVSSNSNRFVVLNQEE